MEIKLVLSISVLLQFIAALLALRLIRVTGSRIAWILIASAISFMAFRRSITLFHVHFDEFAHPVDLLAEYIALATSVLIVIGVALIEPIFLSIKRSEQALRESGEKYRTLAETMNEGLGVQDENGIITYVNDRFCELLGYSREEAIGRTYSEFLDEENRSILEDNMDKRKKAEKDSYELAWNRKDGKRIYTIVSPEPVFDAYGKFKGSFAVLTDITQSKRAFNALQESEQRMESMGLELALGISEVFEALKKISSGDPAVRIPETSEIKLIAKLKHMVNMTAKNIGEFVDQSHEFAICLAEHFDVLNRVSKGDLNARVSGSSQIELLESLKNVTNRMIITVSDEMAERKETEKKLLYASEEWRATFDSMPYGVMLVGREFNIIKTNDYISRLTGIPIKEMIGKKCYQIIHGMDRPIEICPLIKASETLSTETIELYEPRVNKYFMTSVTPMLDEKGHIKSYVHSLVDITETKHKEKELIKSRNAFFNMLNDLDFSYAELKGLYNALIHSFANAIDAKSPWTKGHSERVTNYAIAIAKEMGLQEKDIEILRIAALLHDVGKIGTLDVILDKPGRLNAEEFNLVKMHTVKGEQILKPIKQLQDILPIIRHHHERIDGNGYPDRLKGEEIPLYARILHIADSFDSMTADRPYRPAPGIEYAISELKKYSGTQFDPKVVEAFLNILGNVQEVQFYS